MKHVKYTENLCFSSTQMLSKHELSGQFESNKICLNGVKLDTVFDLITALCAYVFQNYWEHSFVVKCVSTYCSVKPGLLRSQAPWSPIQVLTAISVA